MIALEAMVDRVGVANVLYALQHICNAKADHVLANWQDGGAAREWSKDSNTAAVRQHEFKQPEAKPLREVSGLAAGCQTLRQP